MEISGILPDTPDIPDAAYEAFAQAFEDLCGIRLRLYKEKQMRRRICTLIERKRLHDYDAFLHRLRTDPAELAAFIDYITINVTEFFRTPEHWAAFEREVLPELLARKTGRIRIWSAACSTGEEPYSLAMSLCRLASPDRFEILATDIDEKVLAVARAGIYPEKSVENVSQELLDAFFTFTGNSFRVTEGLKACVKFARLDLLRDPYPEDCDVIVCRNVLIYFTDEAKEQIYRQFRRSLAPGGWLFTGNTEQLIYYKRFGVQKVKNYLYRNA